MSDRAARPIEDIYPLSPLQAGLLAVSLDPRTPDAYFHQTASNLDGPLDAAAWRRAWERAVERHPILRTAFVWEHRPVPLQVVYRRVRIPWEERDLTGLPEAERNALLEAHLTADLARGFDFSRPPLLRFALFHLGPERHRFVWSFHHLLLDGWSLGLLFQEVFAIYEAAVAGRELHLGRPRPFRDVIEWQRSRDLGAAQVFWRQHLAGVTVPTPLPLDREPGAPLPDGEPGYAFRGLRLGEGETAALAAFARRHQLTPSTLLQGAWGLLLARAAGERDVVFGVTLAGRSPALPGVEAILGPLINTLPLRVSVAPAATAAAWLAGLQERMVELREHEASPLPAVQRLSGAGAGRALFESILVYQNFPVRPVRRTGEGSVVVREVRSVERAHYPLGLRVSREPVFSLELGYDRRRESDAGAARLLSHLAALLAGLTTEVRVGEISLLSPAERHQIVAEWNPAPVPFAAGDTLGELFSAQASTTPDAAALLWGEEIWSYGELERHSNRLARHLQALGVGPEVLVGIFLERGPRAVAAILAVLKAGGAYVPLDPSYPGERLDLLVRDSHLAVLLSEERLLPDLPEHQAWVVCLDAEEGAVAGLSPAPLAPTAGPDNLAYLLSTSGSTGTPKGVPIAHRGLVSLAAAEIRAFGLGPGERVLQFASLSFDASAWEMVSALLSGAALCLAPREALLPGPGFAALLDSREVTCATLPPTVAAALPAGEYRALRNLVTAGEACTVDLVARWAGRRFWNAYGPSETTVCATWGRCADATVKPSIGRPIDNVRVVLLDPALLPVPIGFAGELCVASVGLARGYHDRPEMTALRFVPDPSGVGPGERLYRTGDLARYRPDGSIDLLGRIDEQVKVRGFRIEPGEVQAALARHPEILASSVLVREDTPGDRRLVAYVVPRRELGPVGAGHSAALSTALKTHLRGSLPEPMVPGVFVFLSELPVNANGKVDRAALPAPGEALAERAGLELPQKPAEEALAAVFRQVLHVETVGRHDTFLDLGGDSILAVQAVARAVQAGLPLTLGQLFGPRSVAELAAAFAAEEPAEPATMPALPLVPLATGGSGPPLFLVHTGTGSVVPYRHLTRHLGTGRPLYGLQVPDLYGRGAEEPSIERLAAAYRAALHPVQPHGPYLLAGHSGGAVVAFELARQLEADGEEVALLAALDNPAPPECRDRENGEGSESVVVSLANLLERFLAGPSEEARSFTDAELAPLSADERLKLLLERLHRGELAPGDAGLDWVRGFVRLQEGLGRAIAEYAGQPPRSLRAPVALFKTAEFSARYGRADFGWSRSTTGPVTAEELPGDHVSLLTEPHVQALARRLSFHLDQALAPTREAARAAFV